MAPLIKFWDKLPQRFWDYVNKNAPNGCWLWLGELGKGKTKGYGNFKLEGQTHTPNIYSFLEAGGVLSLENPYVCHQCSKFGSPQDNKHCVNPAHLEAGNQKKNTGDAIAAGTHKNGSGLTSKTHCNKGHLRTILKSGRKICPTCTKLSAKEARKNWKEQGLCIGCGQPRSNSSASFCEKHRLIYNETMKGINKKHRPIPQAQILKNQIVKLQAENDQLRGGNNVNS